MFARTLGILRDNREVLDRTAKELLARETLDVEALKSLTHDLKRLALDEAGGAPPRPSAPRPAAAVAD